MTTLDSYRDDGPAAAALTRVSTPVATVPPVALTLLGALPLLVALSTSAADASGWLAGALLWWVLLGSAAAGRPLTGRLDWLVPPTLRLVEYGFLLRLTAVTDPAALPLCYAVLAALALHHYDTVYRERHRKTLPPRWLRMAGGGWEGRMAIGYLLGLAGWLATGLAVAAVLLAVLYASEATVSWLRFTQHSPPPLYADDQGVDA